MAYVPTVKKAYISFPHSGNYNARRMIESVLRDLGIEAFRVESYPSVIDQVLSTIQECDLIIADVSGGDPNVMYELGFAYALRKPTIMVTSKDGAVSVPSALAGQMFLIYDNASYGQFGNHLRAYIQRQYLSGSHGN